MIFLASSPRQPSTGNEHHSGYTVQPFTVYILALSSWVRYQQVLSMSSQWVKTWAKHVIRSCDHWSDHVMDRTYLKVTTNSLFSTMINVIYPENHKTWHKCCFKSFNSCQFVFDTKFSDWPIWRCINVIIGDFKILKSEHLDDET